MNEHPASSTSTLSSATAPSPELADRAPLVLPPGTAIGRYLVLDHLGAGGMGTVHSAWDHELQRKIALKLVRPERKAGEGAEAARTRFLREAQALAQISHPNVVTVFDVGPYGDEVYLAMEFVEGRDLRAFLADLPPPADPRRWPRVVETFGEIGRGLAAVHAAGLVHRDLKPANLMVGTDGRIRVMDFGLARRIADQDGVSGDSASPLDVRLTQTGLRIGTPSYMAPEQFLGEPTDPRSDLFSFCVAFYEALYGQKPFGEGNEFTTRLLAGTIAPRPADSPVPEELHQLILRGLARDPAKRWSSVAELMAACAEVPRRRRRRRIAFFTTTGLVLLGLLAYGIRRQQDNLCREGEDRFAAVFGDSHRTRIAQAFAKANPRFGPDAAQAVIAQLAGWGESWTGQRQDACEATHRRGEQSEDLLDRRMICLDSRLAEFSATVDLLAEGDPALVEKPGAAFGIMDDLESCADSQQLNAETALPPPEQRDELRRLELELVRARALYYRNQGAESEKLTREVAAAAAALPYPPLVAQAEVVTGVLQLDRGLFAEAEATWLRAIATAIEGEDANALGLAAISLARLQAESLGKPQQAAPWLRIAEASIGHLRHQPILQASMLRLRAGIASRLGDNEAALADMKKAMAVAEGSATALHQQAGIANDLGIVYSNLGRYAEAEAALRHGIELDRRLYGDDHPDLAGTLNNLGSMYWSQGDAESALALHLEALELLRKAYGSDHRMVALTLNNAATALRQVGRVEEADRFQLEALAIQERLLGPEHVEVAGSLGNLAYGYRERGELEKALELYNRSRPIFEKNLGPGNFSTAGSYQGTGITLSRLGRHAEALPYLQKSYDFFHSKPHDPRFPGAAAFQLAKTRWEEGSDRAAARRAAQQALADYGREPARFAMEIAAVEAWIAEHR